jgi:hypothetical protein
MRCPLAVRSPRRRQRRFLPAALLVLLVPAAVVRMGGQAASVAAAPDRPAAASAPAAAPDRPAAAAPGSAAAATAPHLEPLPPALERRMNELVHAAERYRGLTLERRVPWGRVSERELNRELAADFDEDLPPERVAAVELSLKVLGLIPESLDLKTFYTALLTSQIAGFYDPHRKVLAVVDRQGGLLGAEAVAQLGADAVHKMEDGLLVHELTHALQDQHFDLDHLDDPDPLSDSGVARLALVEGDASLVMFDDLLQAPLAEQPGARTLLDGLLGEIAAEATAPGSAKLPGDRELAAAPEWFRDTLLFSYSEGASFCLELRRHGGQKLLDYAFAVDPPRSSEQILHPDKWYGHRDDPIVIDWPDLTAALPGFSKAAEGQLGEEGIRILLRQALHGDRHAADAAAAGWGGDRFAVYLHSGRRLLAWIADWDTDEAASRFQAAAAHLGPDWTVSRASRRRVTLVRGDLAKLEVTAGPLLARLAAARAELPANRDLDLARIATPAPHP